MDNIESLQRLVDAVEKSGANVAPTYQEYMPMAFAIANSCGEEGRSSFHRLCRISEKYKSEEADKLYDHALQQGTGANSLGTVFHLAERTGIRLDRKLANLQNLQPLHPHTRTREERKTTGCEPQNASTETQVADDETQVPPLPCFSDYNWPPFLQQIIDCGDSPAQRDILLLGAVTVIGATLNKLISFTYGRKKKYPCLQTFVVAPPASGKGALTWVRRLAEPIHDSLLDAYNRKLQDYRQEKMRRDAMGKEKTNQPEPEQPRMKMFLITGDNSGTGMLENLMDADGAGLICEAEADTVSTAIGSEYGHWSDTLRKSFDHERLAYNRRTNHEYRECKQSYLSVLLSGTPAQVRPLIPSAENGLFSRQVFYCMPPIDEWADQFNLSDADYDRIFTQWGEDWKQLLDSLAANVSNIRLELSPEQKQTFNQHLARLFVRAGAIHGDPMKSTVTRIAINLCRMLSVIALLRSLAALLPSGDGGKETVYNDLTRQLIACPGLSPDPRIPSENIRDGVIPLFRLSVTEADFQAVLSLAEPLYQHACYVLSLLPATETVRQSTLSVDAFFDRLPHRFSRQSVLEEGQRYGIARNTIDSKLKRMTEKGILQKTQRGEYEFATRMRTCVGEAAASFASLQVSAPSNS